MSTVVLYDATNIDGLPWPNDEEGQAAKAWIEPWIRQGPERYVDNIQTRMMALVIDGQYVLPITVNEQEYDNAYVCSPYTHYVSYAKQELGMLKQPLLERPLAWLLSGIGYGMKLARCNRVVNVNNWLLSTNLYPRMTPEHVLAIIAMLQARFPDYAIVFRSLNRRYYPELCRSLEEAGCALVPSRQIYCLDTRDSSTQNAKARWLIKRDEGLLAKHGYEAVPHNELAPADIPRFVQLYNLLYIDKYSPCNPQFNELFFTHALAEKTLRFVALRTAGGRIDGILGYFCRGGILTTPIFGYDTALPLETGLYRMLSAVLFREAQRLGMQWNESSGAAQFKRNRGAAGHWEYSAVMDRHLPAYRRSCWSFISLVANRIGVPLMERHKL
ncbi:GNAT family N-acetyltransferase [Paenibacillus apiarius]|uniref:GNAT family N-acetyltransferase n=1 Tax=Paenibacillus apiarius TaxID=46240 RepID=UPI003B3A6C1D